MYWTYFIELGILQIIAGIIMHNIFNVEGRIGAIAAVIFSGPITLASYFLDEKFQFVSTKYFGIIGIVLGILILLLLIVKQKNK
jgi:hypothetical protein